MGDNRATDIGWVRMKALFGVVDEVMISPRKKLVLFSIHDWRQG